MTWLDAHYLHDEQVAILAYLESEYDGKFTGPHEIDGHAVFMMSLNGDERLVMMFPTGEFAGVKTPCLLTKSGVVHIDLNAPGEEK